MPFYYSDVWPIISRCLESLDRGHCMTLDDLRNELDQGNLRQLADNAGHYPMPPIPPADFEELGHYLNETLQVNRGDEAEHFYVSQNGYCVLIAVLNETVRQYGAGYHRPL